MQFVLYQWYCARNAYSGLRFLRHFGMVAQPHPQWVGKAHRVNPHAFVDISRATYIAQRFVGVSASLRLQIRWILAEEKPVDRHSGLLLDLDQDRERRVVVSPFICPVPFGFYSQLGCKILGGVFFVPPLLDAVALPQRAQAGSKRRFRFSLRAGHSNSMPSPRANLLTRFPC